MKTKCAILVVVALAANSICVKGQSDKTVESSISGITVFLQKAQVTRECKTRLEAGKSNIVVTGLTSKLDPQSVQIDGKGSFVILGISHRMNFLNEFNVPKPLKLLKDSLEYYQKQMGLEQGQREILNKEEQLLMANQKIGGTNQNVTVIELKAMADFFRGRMGEIIVTRMKMDDRIKQLQTRIAKVQAQLNTQNELYGRNTSELVVSVQAENATSAELEIKYVVSNAGWTPVYDIRAVNASSPLRLNYKARVFQSSGEEWKNVKLKLSTGNPRLGGMKPELVSQFLDVVDPLIVQQRYRNQMPQPMVASRKADAAEGNSQPEAQTMEDFTKTVQTTLNTEFDISIPYTVLSSNQPTVVDIRSDEVKAAYRYTVVPKLDLDAFLIANATGWEEFSLLPGEANIFFEGTFVGKSYIDPNSIRDTLTFSLGRDKRIVVKREKVKDFTTRKSIGASLRDTYAYEISVRNSKKEPIKISIEDQVPVSKNSQIEVLVTDMGASNYNKDTGKLNWMLSVAGGETKKTTFKFEVKYPKDKQITGL